MVLWSVSAGFLAGLFQPPREVKANTFQMMSDTETSQRFGAGGSLLSVLKVIFGEDEDDQNLTSIQVTFTNVYGSSWDHSEATSSELADLAIANGGIQLWKSDDDSYEFASTTATQVTLAATPEYSDDTFTILPASTTALDDGNVFFVVLKSDAANQTTDGAQFRVGIASNGHIITSGDNPTVSPTTSDIITIDEIAPTVSSIESNVASGTLSVGDKVAVKFSEEMYNNELGINASNVDTTLVLTDSVSWGTSPTVSWGQNYREVTITVGSSPGSITAGTTEITPAATIVDAGGNACDTTAVTIAAATVPTISSVLGGVGKVIVTFSEDILDYWGNLYTTGEMPTSTDFTFVDDSGEGLEVKWVFPVPCDSYDNMVRNALEIMIATTDYQPGNPTTSDSLTLNSSITDQAGNAYAGSSSLAITAVDTTAPTAVTSVTLTDSDENAGIDGRDVTVSWTAAATDSSFSKYKVYLIPASESFDPWMYHPIDVKRWAVADSYLTTQGTETITVTGNATTTQDSRYSYDNNTISGISYKAYVVVEDDLFNTSPSAASSAVTLVSDISATAGDVVINEIVADPQTDWSTDLFAGTDGLGDVLQGEDEWIELYIKTSNLDISDWAIAIDNATGTVDDISSRIDPGADFSTIRYITSNNGTTTNTQAGDYMVLGGFSGNNSTTQSGFTITLKDAIDGNTIDTQDFGNFATSTAAATEAAARDGASTDSDDLTDWSRTTATLGAANTSNDSTCPTVVSATGVLGASNLKVVFSEPITSFSAATNSSFTLDNSLTVASSELDFTSDSSAKTIRLYLTSGQVLPNAQITVTVAEGSVEDLAENAIGASNRTASFYPTESANSDTQPPTINHMPVGMGAPTTDIDFIARVADTGGSSLSYVRLFYKNPTAVTYSQVDMTAMDNGFYRYFFDSSELGFDNTDIKYYIKAEDNAGNIDTMPMDIMNGQDYAFWISRANASAGTNTVTVTVNDGLAAVTDAIVFLSGFGAPIFTYDGDGVYSLDNVPEGWYMGSIIAPGFMPKMIDNIDVHGATTIATQSLVSTSGDTANAPTVTFTGPSDGSTYVPTDMYDIFMAFSEPMKESTLTTDNITVVDGAGTAVTGTVNYDTYMNEVQFVLSSALSPTTTYTVTVSTNVQDSSSTNMLAPYSFSFTTGDTYSSGDDNYSNTAPPFVIGTSPAMGQVDVALNSKISIEFNKAMDITTLTNDNVRICYSGSTNSYADRIIWVSSSYDTSSNILTITLPEVLLADSDYTIEVTTNVTDENYVMIGGGMGGNYFSSFKTGTANDTTKPTVKGTYPANATTNIAVNTNDISIGFSEAMAASTIIDTNLEDGGNITFKKNIGDIDQQGTIEYDSNSQMAHIIPKVALTVNTQYDIVVTTAVTDINTNAINANYEFSFTTETANSDATPPEVMFANADTFSMAISFSEPMNASSTTATFSVTNPANYTLYSPYDTSTNSGTQLNISSKTIVWDAQSNTAIIQDLSLNPNATFKIEVANVKDLSEYAINSSMDWTMGTVMDATDTQGMLIPGDMMGEIDMFMMGEMPVGVWPMNSMASATTQYFVDIPLSASIPIGGKIVLTFPQGFLVTNATSTATTTSWANQDINGPGPGTVTIANVVTNTTARTITITTAGSATNDTADAYSSKMDFLHFDLKGIVNPPIARDFTTSGYTVDIKTKNNSNVILESLASMPIFIAEAGANNITITINATGITDGETAYIYGGSPMTGPLDQAITFGVGEDTSGTAECTGSAGSVVCIFQSMPDGDYHFFMESSIADTSSGKDYLSTSSAMEPIWVNGSGGSKTFTFADDSADGFYKIAGTIAGGPALEKLTVWAGNPWKGQWIEKDVTLDGDGEATYSIAVKLEDEDAEEDWDVGIHPWMPKGPMMMGPPPEPNFIPPATKRVNVASNNPGTNTVTKLVDYSGSSPVTSTVTNSTNVVTGTGIAFTLSSADERIKGYVLDGSNQAISGVEVYAYNPGGMGMGSHTQTGADGSFSIKVGTGMYTVGAHKPGMPFAPEVAVEVKTQSVTTDGNSNSDVYQNRVIIADADDAVATAVNPLVIKMSRPDYTISGRVTDGSTGIANACVWAYQTNAPGHAEAITDSSGNYTLYVTTGSWTVEAHAPGYGFLGSKTSIINSTDGSASLSAFTPASDLGTITGTVSGLTSNANVNVWAEGANGNKNHTFTNSSGVYTLQVPYDTYTVYAWAPEIGDLPPITGVVVAGAVTSQDFTISETLRTVEVKFLDSLSADYTVANAFVNFTDSTNNFENDIRVTNATSSTLTLPDGNYYVNLHMEGIDSDDVTKTGLATVGDNIGKLEVDGTTDIITFTLPALFTISGQVTVDSVGENNAFVWIDDGTKGTHAGYNTANNAAGEGEDGEYTVSVPAGTYSIGVGKPGYTGPNPTTITVAANTIQNLALTANDYFISGRVWYDTNSSGAYDTGEEIQNAWIWGDKVGGGWAGTESDANGNYELSVAEGDWTINTDTMGYATVQYASKITVSGANETSKNLEFTSTETMIPPATYPIVPSQGGIIDDTATGGTGVKITIPANALGTGTTAAQVIIEPTAPESSNSKQSLETFNIKAIDSGGTAITNLNDDIAIEFIYTKDDVDTFLDANSITATQLADASIDYKSTNTGSNWASTNVVFKPTGDNVALADMDTFAENFDTYDTYTLAVKATTDHLSDYALNIPTDASAPATPTGLTATGNTSGSAQVVLTWTANSEGDLSGYYVYRSTDNSTFPLLSTISAGTETCTDSAVSGGTTYYYRIAAYDTGANESAACTAVSGAPTSVGGYVPPANYSSPSPTPTPAPITEETESEEETTTEIETITEETTEITTTASTHNDGTLIKSADSDKIYVIKRGKKVWIPTWDAFVGGGYLMSDVQTVAAAEIDSTAPAQLIKSADSPKVYLIENGKKRHINDPTVFANSGYSWNNVVTVVNANVNAYTVSNLIRVAGTPEVYQLAINTKRHIPNPEVFNSYQYGWDNIMEVSQTEADAYSDIVLIRAVNDYKVYRMENRVMQWVKNPDVFASYNYRWEDIVEINDTEREIYTEGTVIDTMAQTSLMSRLVKMGRTLMPSF